MYQVQVCISLLAIKRFLTDRLRRANVMSILSIYHLSVTKVNPGKTAERIEMKLGMNVD